MNAQRTMLRSARACRARPLRQIQQYRAQSSASGAANGHTHSSTAIYGGLAGGAAAFLFGYGWYSLSGAKSAVNAAHQTRSYFEASKKKLQENAPEPNEALEWLRKQTSFYAGLVGGKEYVDKAFQDLDKVRDKHGAEVDQIVKEAYEELKDIANKDLSVSTATEAWQVLQKHLKRVTDLASDAAQEILANHPQLQSKIGANVDQLRSLGDSLGPEANKVVEDTWSRMRDIIASSGISGATIPKLQKLVQEKTEQVKKLGEKAWDKGKQEVGPYLDKNPKLKELIENNKKDLLSGNVMELWSKVKEASQSGKTDDLEKYVETAVNEAKQKSGGIGDNITSSIEKFLNQMLPAGGGELMPKFQQFKEMAQKTDTEEMEKLAKSTVNELRQVLEKKLEEGKKLVGEPGKNQ